MSDLKQQVGVMDMRQSQMLIDEEEFDEVNLKDVPKSAQNSIYSGYSSSVRTNLDSRHRNDLKRLEKDKKEYYEVLLRLCLN